MVLFIGDDERYYAEGDAGSQFGQQHGTPNRTGRPPVHKGRGELKPKPVQSQIDTDIWGLAERGHQNDGQIVRGVEHGQPSQSTGIGA